VQAKEREAPLPTQHAIQSRYEQRPELRAYNALERFKTMTADVRGVAADQLDLGGAQALRQAIEAAGAQGIGRIDPETARPGPAPTGPSSLEPSGSASASAPTAGAGPDSGPSAFEVGESADDESIEARNPLLAFPVSTQVEAGDVLVLDPNNPGHLRPADIATDPAVVGIASADPLLVEDRLEVELVDSQYVRVNVDAGYGEIRAGDLLTSSFTPGHAMRAIEIVPGTIVGKALEPLESGTGLIRVLVMPR
jgi:hypothetical protein